jgi:hypothetical protein
LYLIGLRFTLHSSCCFSFFIKFRRRSSSSSETFGCSFSTAAFFNNWYDYPFDELLELFVALLLFLLAKQFALFDQSLFSLFSVLKVLLGLLAA